MPPQEITKRNKILILGANGILGQKLLALLGPKIAIAGTRRPEWDAGEFQHFCIATESNPPSRLWDEIGAIVNVAGSVVGDRSQLGEANVAMPLKLAKAAQLHGVSQFVQLSSFAVYGLSERIDPETPELPVTEYGISKMTCDGELTKLHSDQFIVSILRVPFLFDYDHPALFAPLLKVLKAVRAVPATSPRTKRSMISYSDAARVILSIVKTQKPGVVHAAATKEFDYDLLATIMREEANIRLMMIRFPMWVTSLAERLHPNLARRLFRSNVLNPQLNIARNIDTLEGLEQPLRALVKRYFL